MSASSNQRLPPGWTEATVGTIGRVRVGRQRTPAHQSGVNPTPYLRAANITPDGIDLSDLNSMDFSPAERALYALRPGDLLLTEASGSPDQVGRPAIWGGQLDLCCFQNTVIRIRPHLVEPEFALIVFRHFMRAGVFAEAARGIGIQHLGASRLAELPFLLPPLAEQKRIASEAMRRLSELGAARSSLKRAVARTEEQDDTVLAAAATGRLVPGGAGGGPPTEATGLPEGWRLITVEKAGEVRLGKQRSPANHQGANMRPYLRVANVFEDRLDLDDVKEMSFTSDELETFVLRDGDVLLNEGQSLEFVGRPALYQDEIPGACFQNTLVRFRAGPDVDPRFALIVFRHYMRSGEFARVARGSTNISHLSRSRFVSLLFPLPPLELQNEIVAEAGRRLDESAERRQIVAMNLARVDDLEAEILSAAVSGALVAQSEDEEPAEELMRRLGSPGPDRVDEDSAFLKESELPKKTIEAPKPGEQLLGSVLRQTGPLSLPDLYRAAGFDRNDVGDVERFYLTLREEIGVSIERVGPSGENQKLKAVSGAT